MIPLDRHVGQPHIAWSRSPSTAMRKRRTPWACTRSARRWVAGRGRGRPPARDGVQAGPRQPAAVSPAAQHRLGHPVAATGPPQVREGPGGQGAQAALGPVGGHRGHMAARRARHRPICPKPSGVCSLTPRISPQPASKAASMASVVLAPAMAWRSRGESRWPQSRSGTRRRLPPRSRAATSSAWARHHQAACIRSQPFG
jgi:hypothetical protein